jgi:SAM-dependent methyltransferase
VATRVEREGAPLKPSAAYRLWAPTYHVETAVSALEDRVARNVTPVLAGRRLLDVGCGIGRRLAVSAGGAALAVGVDLVPEMLLAGRGVPGRRLVAAGDVRRLPFAAASFDVVWCRLVLGHVECLDVAYRELAHVSKPGGSLLVSDFHSAAVAAGHTRSFRDSDGEVRDVEHHVHTPAAHVGAAGASGWTVTTTVEAAAAEAERPFYERAGRLRQLELEAGLPLVLVLCFRR